MQFFSSLALVAETALRQEELRTCLQYLMETMVEVLLEVSEIVSQFLLNSQLVFCSSCFFTARAREIMVKSARSTKGGNSYFQAAVAFQGKMLAEPARLELVRPEQNTTIPFMANPPHTMTLFSSLVGICSPATIGTNKRCHQKQSSSPSSRHIILLLCCIISLSLFIPFIQCDLPHTNVFHIGSNNFAHASNTESNIYTKQREIKVSPKSGLKVKDVVTGRHHVLVSLEDGSLMSYGSNLRGQLGIGNRLSVKWTAEVQKVESITEAIASMHASGDKSVILTQMDNFIYEFGDSTYDSSNGYVTSPTRVTVKDLLPEEDFISVHATWDAAFALTDRNRVFAWGKNTFSELGVDRTLTPSRKEAHALDQEFTSGVASIATGAHFIVVLEKNGNIWQWGELGVQNEATTVGTGTLHFAVPTQLTSGALFDLNPQKVTLTANYIVVVSASNEVYLSKNNIKVHRAQLPVDFTSESAQIAAGDFSCSLDTPTCSMVNDRKTALTWLASDDKDADRFQNFGQLSPVTTQDYTIHKNQNVEKVCQLARASIFMVRDSSSLFGVGMNQYAVLGVAEVPTLIEPRPLQFPKTDSAGEEHEIMEFTSISSNKYHSLLLGEDEHVYSLGFNQYGACGDTNNLILELPHRINVAQYCDDESPITAVAAGTRHSLLLNKDNQVLAFGDSLGAFGTERGTVHSFGTCHRLNITKDQDIKQICAGDDYSMALMDDGYTIYKWGLDPITNKLILPIKTEYSQFKESKVETLYCGGQHHIVTLKNGDIYCWGKSASGQCAVPYDTVKEPKLIPMPKNEDQQVGEIKELAVGFKHNLVLNSNGVYAFGDNSHRQIKNSENQSILNVLNIDKLNGLAVDQIATTDLLSIASVDIDNNENAIFVWGSFQTAKGTEILEKARIKNPCTLTPLMDIASSRDGAYIMCKPYLTNDSPPLWIVAVVLCSVMSGLGAVGLCVCFTGGSIRWVYHLIRGDEKLRTASEEVYDRMQDVEVFTPSKEKRVEEQPETQPEEESEVDSLASDEKDMAQLRELQKV